jgi:hypothetical protein
MGQQPIREGTTERMGMGEDDKNLCQSDAPTQNLYRTLVKIIGV